MDAFTVDDLIACYAAWRLPHGGRPRGRERLPDRSRTTGGAAAGWRAHLPSPGPHDPGRDFEVRIDSAFDAVVEACATSRPGRLETWINAPIQRLYGALFARGLAHSVECWRDGAMVGGLYGVSLGAAFFGESMFSTQRDASKVALMHLVARLTVGGFKLLDTQFITDHLLQFGALEISRADYRRRLARAWPSRPTSTACRPQARPARTSCRRSARRHRPGAAAG
jgi:leucyl/phenylalanyl-tRNA--protein transferase